MPASKKSTQRTQTNKNQAPGSRPVAAAKRAKPSSAPARPRYRGSLDKYEAGVFHGWAYCVDDPTIRPRVKVMCGDVLLAEGEASNFREDLLAEGMGDGHYAYSVALISTLSAQGDNEVVVIADDVAVIARSRVDVPRVGTRTIQLDRIDGMALNGHISGGDDRYEGVEYQIAIDGDPIGRSVAQRTGESTYEISFVIPAEYFDGAAHRICAHVVGEEGCLTELAEILAPVLTPWQYLASSKDAVNSLHFSLPPAVTRRLTMLLAHTQATTAAPEGGIDQLRAAQVALQVLNEGYEGRTKFPKLELPKDDQPEVSIVIPVHNKFELTYHCIASLILSRNRTSYEVIVVDDVSEDETVSITEHIANVRVIVNKKNQGFLRNCNMAAAQAKGKYLVMLNNDTEVGPRWLDEMLDVFGRFDKVGAVGAKLLYPDGKLQEAGGIVWGNGEPWNLGRNGNPYDPQWNYVRQADYLTGAAMMIPKAVWDEVGGFSDEFAPCYFEDTDLCFKLRQAGWRTYYTPHAEVIHFEGQSHGTDTSSGFKRYQVINAPKFRQKWVDAYQHNGDAAPENLWRHKDRGIRYRALVIDYATPQPDKDAGSYAAVQEMKLLQALGFKLSFIPENLAHFGTYTQALQKQGVECLHAPFQTSIEQVLRERGREFDLVYITRYTVAERYIDLVRQHAPRAKILFNNADMHFLRELRAALAKGETDLSGPLATRDRELDVMRKADAILSYNETEHAVITSHLLRADNIFKCPWVLEAKGHKTPFEKRSGIAFLGGYRHPPNVEAVEWFIENVMPLLRAQSKERITFHVYGSHLPERLKNLAADDIVMHGFVESLDEVFETCRVFVAPLQSGAGIKGKVLDAISYGVPTVLSPIAAEGIEITNGTNAVIATYIQEWTKNILDLNSDKSAWLQISTNSLTLAKSTYSHIEGQNKLRKAVEYLQLFTNRESVRC